MSREPRNTDVYRLRTVCAASLALLCALLWLAVWAGQATAAPSVPPGLPGPPPGAGSGYPLPPAPGQAPTAGPDGSPTTIPVTSSGPGLLSGTAALQGRRLNLPLACSASGRVTVSVPSLGTLAQAKYRCASGSAVAHLSLTPALAGRLKGMGEVLARLAFVQGGAKELLSLALGSHVPAAGTWTSYYGLSCNAPASGQSQLLAPNFTDTPATTIAVRPWLASYTAATGWQWIGTAGADASSWYSWTATPGGVAEWLSPTGSITPWSWGPISVTPGHGTYLIAVFEVVYWYSHPVYVWQYARSGAGGSANVTYCDYP